MHNKEYGKYEICGNTLWGATVDFDTEKTYMCAEYVEWTNDGDDKDNEAAWLRDHLPKEFYTDV